MQFAFMSEPQGDDGESSGFNPFPFSNSSPIPETGREPEYRTEKEKEDLRDAVVDICGGIMTVLTQIFIR